MRTWLVAFALLLTACSSGPSPSQLRAEGQARLAQATALAEDANTAARMATDQARVLPTSTPWPTMTPIPTATAIPTSTPEPTATATAQPTLTPTPTPSPTPVPAPQRGVPVDSSTLIVLGVIGVLLVLLMGVFALMRLGVGRWWEVSPRKQPRRYPRQEVLDERDAHNVRRWVNDEPAN